MWRAKRSRYAYLYILPFFIVFLIFKLYPIIYTFVLSLCDMDLLSGDLTYVAWDNYSRLLHSEFFYRSIGNTLLIWIMSIIPQLTIAFILALILSNKWFCGRFILRNVYYFPNLVTPVTIGLLFGAMFSYPGGAVNNIINALGLEAVDHPCASSSVSAAGGAVQGSQSRMEGAVCQRSGSPW